jgi:Response regulator of the LytR/AlgR family
MFRIAICDDETIFAEELNELISDFMMERGLVFDVDIYSSGEELVALGIEMAQYTIVFLDINMDKVDGIMAAQKIREVSREVFIVFVTAYIKYSLEGYRLGAIRYLLKGTENFRSTVNECMEAIIDSLNYNIVKRTFDFKEGAKEISLERLLYIESNLHKLEFHVMEDAMQVYTMYETLNVIENRLAENDFVRIHQSYLVNMKYVKNIVRYKVVLTNRVELAIPKARYSYVKRRFITYQGEV